LTPAGDTEVANGANIASGGPGSQATLALSTNRETLDTDKEFEQLRELLLGKE
jgi:cytochrome c biogenesis protein